MTVEAIAFDAYGTLFDVYSIEHVAEEVFPDYGKAISETWRDKQIELKFHRFFGTSSEVRFARVRS